MRVWFLFIALLAVITLLQAGIWQLVPLTDQSLWQARVSRLQTDLTSGSGVEHLSLYSQHPGTAVLLLAQVGQFLGWSPLASLRFSLTILNGLLLTASAYVAYSLHPKTGWWIGLVGFLLFHPMLFQASPTDAIMATSSVLFVLLSWWLVQSGQRSMGMLAGLGATLGIALATRIHITFIFLVPLLLMLSFRLGWKHLFFILGIGAIGGFVLNPLLWFQPLNWLNLAIFGQIGFFTGAARPAEMFPAVSVSDLVTSAPLTLLALVIAGFLVFRRQAETPVPRWFLTRLLVATGIATVVLLLSELQSVRYFIPLFFVWDALLLLFVLHLTSFIHVPVPRPLFKGALLVLVLSSQLALFGYVLNFPAMASSVIWDQQAHKEAL